MNFGISDDTVFIDLTADFRAVNPDEIWFREGHFHELGHKYISKLLAEKLPLE